MTLFQFIEKELAILNVELEDIKVYNIMFKQIRGVESATDTTLKRIIREYVGHNINKITDELMDIEAPFNDVDDTYNGTVNIQFLLKDGRYIRTTSAGYDGYSEPPCLEIVKIPSEKELLNFKEI
jgi:hypothetical protein